MLRRHRAGRRSLLVCFLALGCPAACALDGTPDRPPAAAPATPTEAALAYLTAQAPSAPALPAGLELAPARVSGWRGRHAVHLAQRYHGLPVAGGGVVVHVDADNRVTRAVTTAAPDLSVSPAPTLGEDEARAALQASLPGEPAAPLDLELAVLPDVRGGELVYQAVATTRRPLGVWRVRVDAHTGHVHPPASLLRRASGSVYPVNPEVGPPETAELLDLAGDGTLLSSDLLDVYTGEEGARDAAADEAGDFFYEPDPPASTDPFAEVSAYFHLTAAQRYFDDTFELRLDRALVAIVNYSEGGQIYFDASAGRESDGTPIILVGQSETEDLSYDGMTLAHEYGHLVFDALNDVGDLNGYPVNADSLGFHGAPQAFNEGHSDYWGASRYDDPEVYYISESTALYNGRDLDNDLRCPDDLWGEAHLDAPVVSGALWTLREELGADLADELVFALDGQVSDTPTFAEIDGLIRDDLEAMQADGDVDAATVASLFERLDVRGLQRCGRGVALEEGVPQEQPMAGAEAAAAFAQLDADLCDGLRAAGIRIPLPMPYFIETPEEPIDALVVDVDVVRQDGAALAEGDLEYSVLLRRGAPLHFGLSLLPLGEQSVDLPTTPIDADLEISDSPAHVRVESAELELEPGDAVYLDLIALNCPNLITTVTVTFEDAAVADPDSAGDAGEDLDAGDAGADVTAPSGSGHDDEGCQTAGGHPDLSVVALFLALLLILRRAKRRPAPTT